MDWPDAFATKKEIEQLEAQGYTIVPYTVESDRGQPVVFAAIVYSEDEATVSGWYYHPKQEEWVEEGRTETTKVIPQKRSVFEGGINVFGEAGKEAERLQTSIGDTLTHYLGDPPFMYDKESAQALQPSSNVGDCNCSPEKEDQLAVSEIKVRNGDNVPVIGCPKCGQPYRIGTPAKNISIEAALNVDWAFSDNQPEPIATSEDCTFYHVDNSMGNSTHFVVAALISEVNSEIQFAQDYNARTDEFFLTSSEGKLVGFLSWNTEWEKPSITQLYVRPDARGNNYGKSTVAAWSDYIPGKVAYAEHMNEASRPIFHELGLLEGGERDFTVKEFIGIDVQKRKMDKNFYEAFPSIAFPEELGVN